MNCPPTPAVDEDVQTYRTGGELIESLPRVGKPVANVFLHIPLLSVLGNADSFPESFDSSL